MKKKITPSRKKTLARTVKSKQVWYKTLPVKFSYIAVSVLGCLTLLAVGAYHFAPQSPQEDVLAAVSSYCTVKPNCTGQQTCVRYEKGYPLNIVSV